MTSMAPTPRTSSAHLPSRWLLNPRLAGRPPRNLSYPPTAVASNPLLSLKPPVHACLRACTSRVITRPRRLLLERAVRFNSGNAFVAFAVSPEHAGTRT